MVFISVIILLVIVFVTLILIFSRIMTQNVSSATKHLEDLNREYTKKEREVSKQLAEARTKSQEMLMHAQDEAQRRKNQVIKEAELEKDEILRDARTQSEELIKHADKSRLVLLAEVNDRIAKEAVVKACELIQLALPDKIKEEVHQQWLQELIEKGFGDLGNVRVADDVKEIKLVSAFPLSDKDGKTLSKMLKQALKSNTEIKISVNPKVVAGIVITIGSLVLDGSLKHKIQEQARKA